VDDGLPSLKALRANEQTAWEAAYPILWRAAVGVIRSKLMFPETHDIDDIAADILADEVVPQVLRPTTNSFNNIRSFDDLVNVTKAIARNRVVDYIRYRMRRPEEREPEKGHSPDVRFAEPDCPEFSLEELLGIIGRLPSPDPELFQDRFVLGLTTSQIARKRRMPLGTVLSRFRRAFLVLRPNLRRLRGGT